MESENIATTLLEGGSLSFWHNGFPKKVEAYAKGIVSSKICDGPWFDHKTSH